MNTVTFHEEQGTWDIIANSIVASDTGALKAGLYGATLTLEAGGTTLSSNSVHKKDAEHAQSFSDELGNGERARFSFEWAAPRIRAEVIFKTYHARSFVSVQTILTNTGANEVELGKLFMPRIDRRHSDETERPAPHVQLGNGMDSAKVFVESGSYAWSGVLDINTKSQPCLEYIPEKQRRSETREKDVPKEGVVHHASYGMGVVFNPKANIGCMVGALTFERVNPYIVTAYHPKNGIEFFAVLSNFAGFRLRPRQTINTEVFFIDFRNDPLAALEEYGRCVKTVNHIVVKERMPIGWLNHYFGEGYFPAYFEHPEKYEEMLLANMTFMHTRFAGYGVTYVWISQINQKRGLPDFPEERNKFLPHGISWLVNKLTGFNMKLGLWTPPFWFMETGAMSKERGRFLRKKNGEYTDRFVLSFHLDNKYVPSDERPVVCAVDPTHPVVRRAIKDRFSSLTEMGARYHMVDFTMGAYAENGDYHDKNVVPGLEAYRMGMQAVREGAGDDVYLLDSSGPSIAGIGIRDAVRVGPDYGESMTLQCADWRLHQEVASNMSGKYFTHKNFFINDSMNCLLVGDPCPAKTAQFSVGMFALCGGPIMLADDFTVLSEEKIRLIEKCLPSYGHIARPIDLFRNTKPDGYPSILHVHAETDWDTWEIVGLVNYGLTSEKRHLRFKDLGLEIARGFPVFDFWKEQFLGVFQNEVEVDVAARSLTILRINSGSRKNHPWVLATNMHVIQGAAELKNVKWDNSQSELSGIASRSPGSKGKIFLTVPDGFEVDGVSGEGVLYQGTKDGIAVVEITFSASDLEFKVITRPF